MSSYLVDRLAVGLGNKHDCDLSADDVGDVFGSEDRDSRRGGQSLSRWAGMISLDGYGMPGPQLCGPFRASTHLFFAAAGRRYKTPYCGNLGTGGVPVGEPA